MRFRHVRGERVVVARERNATLYRVLDEEAAVLESVPPLQVRSPRELNFERLVAPAVAGGVMAARVFDIAPLALAGRMVHE